MPVDDELKKALNAAKSKPHNFALIVGSKTGMIVARTTIGGGLVKEKQKELGGGQVVRGKVYGEDGVMVFETAAKVSSSLNQKIKKIIKEDAGLTMNVETREKDSVDDVDESNEKEQENGDAEVKTAPKTEKQQESKVEEKEEKEQEEEETPKSNESNERAELVGSVVKRVKALTSLINEAQEADAGKKAVFAKLIADANNAAKAGDKEAMQAAIATLEQDIKATLKSRTQNQADGILRERLKKMLPKFKEAEDIGPQIKSELNALLNEAKTAANSNNVQETMSLLENLEADIEAALEANSKFAKKVAALKPAYDKAVDLSRTLETGADEELTATMKEIQSLNGSGKADEAIDKLDSLSARINSVLRAALARKEIREAGGSEVVKYKTLRLRWVAARTSAIGELERLVDRIVADADVVDDPRYDEIVTKANGLTKLFPKFDGKLEDALDELDDIPDLKQKGEAKKNALKVLANYQSALDEEPMLRDLENSPLGKVSIYSGMAKALNELKAMLSK